MMVLRCSDRIIDKNIHIIKTNLELLEQYFAANDDLFEWVRPKAGGTGFVKFKGPISANSLASQLLAQGILVFPPSVLIAKAHSTSIFASASVGPPCLGP